MFIMNAFNPFQIISGMADKKISDIIKDIKSLKIQGARNVAISSVKVFMLFLKNNKFKSKEHLVSSSLKLAMELMNSRPTEPMTRNILEEISNYMIYSIEKSSGSASEIKDFFIEKEHQILKNFVKSIDETANIGANYLQEDSTAITYCHSSSVTAVLKKAHDMNKNIKVICCETRPLFQGRITAKELSNYGIETTLVVDGAMGHFAKKADFAIVGADAVTVVGDLINKIGTLSLARVMESYGKSFFSVAEIYKYDPHTLYGFREKIEERAISEVFDDKIPKKLKIRNPAFDVTPSRFINAYITNAGICNPGEFSELFEKNKHLLLSLAEKEE